MLSLWAFGNGEKDTQQKLLFSGRRKHGFGLDKRRGMWKMTQKRDLLKTSKSDPFLICGRRIICLPSQQHPVIRDETDISSCDIKILDCVIIFNLIKYIMNMIIFLL